MSAVFADTFYWIALTNKRDSAHATVMNFTANLRWRMVITNDEVLTEFLGFCASDEILRGVAGRAVTRLLSKPDIHYSAKSKFLHGGPGALQ